MNSLKELKGVSHTNTNAPTKKSKGQLFKERHGFSLTMAKNIKKQSGSSDLITAFDIEVYKAARKARKKIEKRAWQKKREASGIYMATKGSGKRKTKHKSRSKRGSATNRYIAPVN